MNSEVKATIREALRFMALYDAENWGDDATVALAAIEREPVGVWEPVEDGFKHGSIYTTEAHGEWWIALSGEGRRLPDDIRLCRRAPSPQSPKEDV